MKKLFFSLLAVAAMASCSKSELTERPVQAGDVEIMAASNAKAISTRAPFVGAIAADNTLLAKVLVSQTSKDYTTLWNTADDQMEFDGEDQKGFKTTPSYFPTDGSDVYLRGFYPSTGWTVQPSSNNIDYTIDGKTDVMYAKEVKTNKAEALAGTYQTLEFEHLLTQLVIKVQAEDESAADEVAKGGWGKITDIHMVEATPLSGTNRQIYPVVRVDMTEAAAVTYRPDSEGERLESLACYAIDEDGKFTDDAFAAIELTYPTEETEESFEAPAVAYSLVPPVTASEKHYTLFVATEGEPNGREIDVTLNTTENAAFENSTVGYAFEITLTFKASEIMAKATVADWKEGGNTNVDVE